MNPANVASEPISLTSEKITAMDTTAVTTMRRTSSETCRRRMSRTYLKVALRHSCDPAVTSAITAKSRTSRSARLRKTAEYALSVDACH